jgi:hypothetical protein
MSKRVVAAVVVMVWSCLIATVPAAEVVLNYEFSNEPHLVSSVGLLGSPGGGYWNRVDSSFFGASLPVDQTMVRDQFGNLIPPGDPFAFPPTQLVPVPRPPIFGGADTVFSSLPQGPLVGSLTFGRSGASSVNIVDLVNAFPDGRYDVAIYWRPLNVSGGQIKLTDISGNVVAEPAGDLPSIGSYNTVVFHDVQPVERHIGPPGTQPMGFGITYFVTPFSGAETPLIEIAGIQIRGHIPEPDSLALAGAGLALAFGGRFRRPRLAT